MFDLDGVLIDSEPVWEEVRRELVASHGGHWAPDAQRRLMGMSTQEWARYLSEDLGVGLAPDEVAAQVIQEMAGRYARHLPLMPGAVGRRAPDGGPLAARAGQLLSPGPDRDRAEGRVDRSRCSRPRCPPRRSRTASPRRTFT